MSPLETFLKIGLITRSHSILSFGIEPGFIPCHSIALIGTPSTSAMLFLANDGDPSKDYISIYS
jgi:hypothetical protein